MTCKIYLHTGFRSSYGQRMAKLWHPGPYAVPSQMPDPVAQAAIKAGVATTEADPVVERPVVVAEPAVEEPPASDEAALEIPGVDAREIAATVQDEFMRAQGSEPEPGAEDVGDPEPADAEEADEDEDERAGPPTPKRRRRTARRKLVPANKSRGRAPEDKTAGA